LSAGAMQGGGGDWGFWGETPPVRVSLCKAPNESEKKCEARKSGLGGGGGVSIPEQTDARTGSLAT